MEIEIELDNPTCPACKHYNAIIYGKCRDCGFEPGAAKPEALDVDTLDVANPKCRTCDLAKPVNVDGVCESCFVVASPAATVSAAETGVVDALLTIGEQASTDANALNLGTVANGRATLGVGFRNAEGYIEALRRGVARATLDEYASTLRSRYGFTVSVAVEDNRYAVRLSMTGRKSELLEADLLAPGTAEAKPQTADQLAVEEANRAAMRALSQRAREQKAKAKAAETAAKAAQTALAAPLGVETREQVSAKVVARDVMIVADAAAVGALFGFNGEGRLTRKQIADAWAKTGLPVEWLPKLKTARAQAGRAVAILKRAGVQVFPEKKGEREAEEKKTGIVEPHDFAWFVGSIARRAKVGETLGETELVVKLTGDALSFEGSAEMAKKVADEFKRRTDTELYESTWIRDWLRDDVLKARFDAVDYNACGLYVPRQHVSIVRKIVEAISGTGWGTGWVGGERRPPLPLVSSADLGTGLCAGLEDEVEKHLSDLEKHREHVRQNGADDVGKVAAANHVARVREVGKRVHAYSGLLGEERTEMLWSRIRDAMGEVESLLDDPIIQRFALIREEIQRDREAAGGVIGANYEDEEETTDE